MSSPVSINSFISEIVSKRGGPSTPVLYSFDIAPPAGGGIKEYMKGLNILWDNEFRFLNYLNNEIQIPGITFQNSEVRMPRKGLAIKSAGAKIYNEMDLTFICDATALPYRFFRGWIDWIGNVTMSPDIYDPASTRIRESSVLRYYDQYTCDLTITKMEKFKAGAGKYKTPYSVTLVKAWPYTIASIPMSQASQNGLVKVSVSLYYEYSKTNISPSAVTESAADEREEVASTSENAGRPLRDGRPLGAKEAVALARAKRLGRNFQ
jgi:hypothetical protein